MVPSWELKAPTQVDKQVVSVHVVCMQQSYVIHEKCEVPIQLGKRPLEVGVRNAEVVEMLSL